MTNIITKIDYENLPSNFYKGDLKITSELYSEENDSFMLLFEDNPELMEFLNDNIRTHTLFTLSGPTGLEVDGKRMIAPISLVNKDLHIRNLYEFRSSIAEIVINSIKVQTEKYGFKRHFYLYTIRQYSDDLNPLLRASLSGTGPTVGEMEEMSAETVDDIFGKDND